MNIRVYGACGQCSCLYYNIYIAEAITRQGRSYISTSIMFFESFLGNNVKFNSLNEIITFINNVVREKDERKINDSSVLDRNITVGEAFYKLLTGADMAVWIPTESEMSLVWDYLLGLSQEDINRLYYKNNLYSFVELPVISSKITEILQTLRTPFINPNKPPKEIKGLIKELYEYFYEYVYYHYFYIDKLDRIEYMQRDICMITDTDSTIISLDAWYRCILNMNYDKPMHIKNWKFDMVSAIKADEFGDKPLKLLCTEVEPEYDYDFYSDEYTEVERKIDIAHLIPQDAIKYSIINIIANICGELIIDYMRRYSINQQSYAEGKPCELIMKNEFYFLKALIKAKRNYASLQLLQEGNVIPEGERMAISGLPINKSTLSDAVKDRLQQITYEELLTSDEVDQKAVIRKLAMFEKEIFDKITSGSIEYYKPDNVNAMSKYADPLSQNGIVASLVYNELRTDDMPALNLNERNKVLKIKIVLNKNNVGLIKESYPEIYDKMVALLAHPKIGTKVTTIAIPLGRPVPDWIKPFIDTNTIINDIIRNFPIEAAGFERGDNANVSFSNIISL